MKREAQPSQGRQNTSPAHIRKRCRAFRNVSKKGAGHCGHGRGVIE